MTTTNVKAPELNYDHYSTDKYDQDIINSIPFHKELHETLLAFIEHKFDASKTYSILELGTGTGITSRIVKEALPKAEFDLVDFSRKMLSGARKKMGTNNVQYIFGDYSKLTFTKKYDLIVSVIGIHHQNRKGKKALFRKIYSLLKPNGMFVFGDLVTHKNPQKAALNQALHFHHLVEKATDRKTLEEWAYHHYVLNDLASIEEQIEWMRRVGFHVKTLLLKVNTALLVCKKTSKSGH
ncbi:MAG: class I SAM-dependent methyltransferase [Alphaproteobacteria bacterium]|nr:class I SAM-dependent methyltransferase [Alphaproteobacteria bacterium]